MESPRRLRLSGTGSLLCVYEVTDKENNKKMPLTNREWHFKSSIMRNYFIWESIHSIMFSVDGRGALRLMRLPYLSTIMKRGMPVIP